VTPPVAELEALFSDPAAAARRACEARARAFGRTIWVRSAPPCSDGSIAIIRDDTPDKSTTCLEHPVPGDMSSTPGWLDVASLRSGDRLVLRVEHHQLSAYCAWLVRAAAVPKAWALAPWCPTAGGLFRLHLIAAARLALPANVRVEARHDLHGVRLAQVALGFGADTLSGPIDIGRHLPLAGVPRPSETTQAALFELVRQAGLEATTHAHAERTAP
jgi:hypothetical protein